LSASHPNPRERRSHHGWHLALANRGRDTRALQVHRGHRNIQHTVRNALGRKVTGDELARPELTYDRLLVRAQSPGERTARAKTAAGRWRIR
jgi:hypothetical protein